MSSTVSVEEVRAAITKFEGVPAWWAEVFVAIGLNVTEAVTWVTTAQVDCESPLYISREKEMNAGLVDYAAARGITLVGAGTGQGVSAGKGERFVHWVNTITTPEEQEAIVREVGGFADVRFKENLTGVYTSHAVANAVRSVHLAFLRRFATPGMCVLEAGASLKSAVLNGLDVTRYHACCPVLDVRDSVRHSLTSWLQMVVASTSKYKPAVVAAAKAALDESTGFVCRQRAQDCTRQVDLICSNESTHDIAFSDLPRIMARHGARLWVGFMTRAPGARSVGGPNSGQCSVMGTRWVLDRQKDEISFHFRGSSAFSYTHKFSEWVCYEEQFGYRWRGQYFDYVYTRLPVTTASSLAFAVVRVPKTRELLPEPVYQRSSYDGMVEVTSVRAVGGCLGSVKPTFEPVKFTMEAVVFDRVLETRLALGERGGLASTLAYMRSMRVRLSVNGVALGATSAVPVDDLEAAAVAVEVLAADCRKAGDRDYEAIIKASVSRSVLTRVIAYFSGVAKYVGAGDGGVIPSIRMALARVLDGREPVTVRAVRCPPYVKVSEGGAVGVVVDVPILKNSGCGCAELISVRTAIRMGSALTALERRALRTYELSLVAQASGCDCNRRDFVTEEEAAEVFQDALEKQTDVTVTDSERGESQVSSVVDAEVSEGTSVTCYDSDVVTELDLSGLTDGSGDSQEKRDTEVSSVVASIREYADWAKQSDVAVRSEAETWYRVLFQSGNPTNDDLEWSTTARTRHTVLAVVNGKVTRVYGSQWADEEHSEIYVPSLRKTVPLSVDKSGRKEIRESVTELCYTNTQLRVVNGDKLCRGATEVLASIPVDFTVPRYKYIDGVPGCGKTYEITQKMVAMVGSGKRVLYLTATRASCEKVQSELKAESVAVDMFACATYDSFVINGSKLVRKRGVDCVFMDEAAMAHKGELYVCMIKAGCPTVELYGDTKQIPWLPFMAEFTAVHAVIGNEFEVERRSVTHRFGSKTCAMWLDVYGSIYPCGCHEHSDVLPEVVKISSASDVPSLPTGKLLTFTQEEKVMVKRECGLMGSISDLKGLDNGGLSTVAEDQGGTHGDVSIVRAISRKNPKESSLSPSIYNKQPWVLVATTRHRNRLKYYTTADDDLVAARIKLASDGVRLEAVRSGMAWSDIVSRAKTVPQFGI